MEFPGDWGYYRENITLSNGGNSLTQAEWDVCDNAAAMIDFLWQQHDEYQPSIEISIKGILKVMDVKEVRRIKLAHLLHGYYIQSCFFIWDLIPQEASRIGLEIAEWFHAGFATEEELHIAEWNAEAAVFTFDFDHKPELVKKLIADVENIPKYKLSQLLHPPETADRIDPKKLLRMAANFVNSVMVPLPYKCRDMDIFLSASLLRRHVTYSDWLASPQKTRH